MEPVQSIGSKLIVITGCNKGVGFGILKNLAARPDNHHFIVAVRSTDRGKQAVEDLEKVIPKVGERITIKELDVSNTASIDNFVNWIKDSGKKIDCFINNAGMAFKGDAFDKEVVRVTFQTNFYGTIDLTEKILPYIVDSGKIISVTSSGGKLERLNSEELKKEFTDPAITRDKIFALAKRFYDTVVDGTFEAKGWPRSAYRMSKLCLNVYLKDFGKNAEVVKRGIQIYACCPGWVRTDMAGPKAPRTIEEGAVCPCDLVYFPWKINPEWQGNFFYDSKLTPI